jgi:hypothetical protein
MAVTDVGEGCGCLLACIGIALLVFVFLYGDRIMAVIERAYGATS